MEAARIFKEQRADNALVCFHCQQAVEKHLKGYVFKHSRRLCEGHGLARLCKACLPYQDGFRSYLKELALIGEYYIETRYPADQPLEVTGEDAGECLGIAEPVAAEDGAASRMMCLKARR